MPLSFNQPTPQWPVIRQSPKVSIPRNRTKPLDSEMKRCVILPDAQNYTALLNSGSNETFKAQTQWVMNNRVSRNIVYVNQNGDITNDGDNAEVQWKIGRAHV